MRSLLPATVQSLLILALILSAGPASRAAQPETGTAVTQRVIDLELVADRNAEVGLQQEWMEAMERSGLDRFRILTARSPSAPAVEEVRTGGLVTIKLRGILNGRTMKLPGREFSINNLEGLREYATQLKADGAALTLAEKVGFGLTSEQLVGLHSELSAPLGFSTRGQAVGVVVEQILAACPIRNTVGGEVAGLLRNEQELVRDELQGLSAGTALAAAIRPLGLVLVPRRLQGQEMELTIVASEEAEEHWPIGWPTEGPTNQIEPKLYDRIDVEIRDFKLVDALNAVSGRVGIPFLFDHNSLARKEIDPATTLVTFAKPKQSYYAIITRLCSQTRPALVVDLRLDEAGKPFFWIH